MFWFRRKVKPVLELGNAINISKKTFYPEERPATPKHHMLCVAPDDGDEAECFSDFMRLCAERLLADFDFVVERVRFGDIYQEMFIADFLDSGGKVVLPQKDILFAISGARGPRLVELVPNTNLGCYEYNIYAFSQPLTIEQMFDPGFNFQVSNFALRLFCHEQHDYFLMESTQDLEPFIDMIRSVCQEQGRELIVEL